jgi:hypothetical protein
MCFSPEMSMAAGVTLLPAGAYSMSVAFRKDRHYLPIAVTPLLFGIQQLCEAGVWRGIDRGDASLVESAAIAYLFFAIAFWPGWVPLGIASIEGNSGKRRLFLIMSIVGFGLGALCYFPATLHYGQWLTVGVVGHSIRYDFSRMPDVHTFLGVIWQLIYFVNVTFSLLMSRDHQLRPLGITIALSAAAAQILFQFAFISVWCFFAAIVSVHIVIILLRLPNPPSQFVACNSIKLA